MNRIRELRQQNGWTQDDLAVRMNTKRQAIGHYETGARGIDADTICRLCDIFGCTADYLLGRSPMATPDLDPAEEDLLLAWRAAPSEIRAIIDTALAPYREEADEPGAAAPTA